MNQIVTTPSQPTSLQKQRINFIKEITSLLNSTLMISSVLVWNILLEITYEGVLSYGNILSTSRLSQTLSMTLVIRGPI